MKDFEMPTNCLRYRSAPHNSSDIILILICRNARDNNNYHLQYVLIILISKFLAQDNDFPAFSLVP